MKCKYCVNAQYEKNFVLYAFVGLSIIASLAMSMNCILSLINWPINIVIESD